MREFNLPLLAAKSKNFSGAEIEQAIIDAMHRAFASTENGHRRDFITEDILRSIEETVPLALIAHKQIEELKQWAAQAGARTASADTALAEELRKHTIDYGIQPLETD